MLIHELARGYALVRICRILLLVIFVILTVGLDLHFAHNSVALANALAPVCNPPDGSLDISRGNKAERSLGLSVTTPACTRSHDDTDTTIEQGSDSAAKESQLDSADTISIGSGECQWKLVEPPPPAGDPSWEGNDPSTGSVITNSCNGPIEYRFLPGPNPAAPPPPPDPAVLAQRAYSELEIPPPSISAGPDRTKLAVNLWTWLWVDNPGQLSATVAAGGVSVTATATLATVTWTLGEPAAASETYQPGSPATITCQGAGTAPPASYDWKAEPPCGYKYHWRSLKERTGGTGTWPITATTNWTVTWQSNTGVTGGTTLNATSNDQFDIGEYRTVLVQGTGGG